MYPGQGSSRIAEGSRSNAGVSGICSGDYTGNVTEDGSGDGSGVFTGSGIRTELAQAKERIRLVANNSRPICLKNLIFISNLIPLYWLIFSCVKP